jgi:hypothetical protein
MNPSSKHLTYGVYTILSILLLIRHSQYYVFQNITTEYGFNQPLWGIFLVPITASFGVSFCIGRRVLIRDWSKNYKRLLVLLALPFFLATVFGFTINDIIDYSIYDTDRRPPFLILLSIFFCIFIYDSINKRFENVDTYVILFGILIISTLDNFIIYYTALMISSAYVFNKIETKGQEAAFLLAYLSITISTQILGVTRLSGVGELLTVVGLLVAVSRLSQYRLYPILKFSMLEFYILQAVLFSLISHVGRSSVSFIIVIVMTYGLLILSGRMRYIGRP